MVGVPYIPIVSDALADEVFHEFFRDPVRALTQAQRQLQRRDPFQYDVLYRGLSKGALVPPSALCKPSPFVSAEGVRAMQERGGGAGVLLLDTFLTRAWHEELKDHVMEYELPQCTRFEDAIHKYMLADALDDEIVNRRNRVIAEKAFTLARAFCAPRVYSGLRITYAVLALHNAGEIDGRKIESVQ